MAVSERARSASILLREILHHKQLNCDANQ
jgi:hypothetical protein